MLTGEGAAKEMPQHRLSRDEKSSGECGNAVKGVGESILIGNIPINAEVFLWFKSFLYSGVPADSLKRSFDTELLLGA